VLASAVQGDAVNCNTTQQFGKDCHNGLAHLTINRDVTVDHEMVIDVDELSKKKR